MWHFSVAAPWPAGLLPDLLLQNGPRVIEAMLAAGVVDLLPVMRQQQKSGVNLAENHSGPIGK